MNLPRSWSRFQSADQMQEPKEDMAETIREWVRSSNQYAGKLETLTRMSRKDLSDLMHAVLDASKGGHGQKMDKAWTSDGG